MTFMVRQIYPNSDAFSSDVLMSKEFTLPYAYAPGRVAASYHSQQRHAGAMKQEDKLTKPIQPTPSSPGSCFPHSFFRDRVFDLFFLLSSLVCGSTPHLTHAVCAPTHLAMLYRSTDK